MMKSALFTCIAVLLAASGPAFASATAGQRCENAKNRAVGKYASCRQVLVSKSVLSGFSPDFARCTDTMSTIWEKAESAAAGDCPTDGDVGEFEAYLAAQSQILADALAGDGLPTCGNGILDVAGEHCDATDLGGTACTDLGWSSGDLACNSSCRFDTSDCSDCPMGSEPVGEYCWTLAPQHMEVEGGITCDEACAGIGLTCNEAGVRSVGSDGTLSACRDMVDLLEPGQAPHGASDSDVSTYTAENWAVGCVVTVLYPSTVTLAHRMLHSGSPTVCGAGEYGAPSTSGAGLLNRRVCACDRP